MIFVFKSEYFCGNCQAVIEGWVGWFFPGYFMKGFLGQFLLMLVDLLVKGEIRCKIAFIGHVAF